MAEWWTYSLADFLLFSPRTYYRLIELYNRDIWPAQLLVLAAGLALLFLIESRTPLQGRLITAILALSWLWVAWAFHYQRYATINWAIAYVAPLFVLEAVMLMLAKGTADRPLFNIDRSVAAGIGLTFYLYALVLHPLVPLIEGRTLRSAEVFAIAPDPTAIATLGLLTLAPVRKALLLGIIPAAWCLASWATLHTMGSSLAAIPLAAVGLALLALAIRLSSN